MAAAPLCCMLLSPPTFLPLACLSGPPHSTSFHLLPPVSQLQLSPREQLVAREPSAGCTSTQQQQQPPMAPKRPCTGLQPKPQQRLRAAKQAPAAPLRQPSDRLAWPKKQQQQLPLQEQQQPFMSNRFDVLAAEPLPAWSADEVRYGSSSCANVLLLFAVATAVAAAAAADNHLTPRPCPTLLTSRRMRTARRPAPAYAAACRASRARSRRRTSLARCSASARWVAWPACNLHCSVHKAVICVHRQSERTPPSRRSPAWPQ